MLRTVFVASLFSLFAICVHAQTVISGELRPRIEFRDGYKTLRTGEQKPALIATQRSRLNLSHKENRFAIKLSVQDVRTWGESPYKTDEASLGVYEAWGEFFFTPSWSIRLGRQVLSYDENRFLGSANWNNLGASHDLLLLKYHKEFDVSMGFAYNNDKSKNHESDYALDYYKNLAFIRAEKDLGRSFNIVAMVLADGFQKEGDSAVIYERITYGSHLNFGRDSLRSRLSGSFFLQNGKSPDGRSVNAYFFSLKAAFDLTRNMEGMVAVDYFSGNDAFSDDTLNYHAFNNLYGNGHGFYGYMDYFSRIDESTGGGGLMDVYGRFTNKLGKKTTSELTCHYFALTNNIIDSVSTPGVEKKADPHLGSEIDWTLKHKPVSNLEISAGYSVMFATPTMEILKGGDRNKLQHFAWLMFTFKPEFLNIKKDE